MEDFQKIEKIGEGMYHARRAIECVVRQLMHFKFSFLLICVQAHMALFTRVKTVKPAKSWP